MTTRDEARERLARIIDPSAFKTMREVAADNGLNVDAAPACVVFDESVDIPIGNRRSLRVAALTKADAILALLSPDAGGDQPRPSVSEDQGASRDHALTDGVALDGWQPIETAPRDGTEILIAIGSDYIGSAFYAVVAIGSDYIGSAFYADDDSDPYPWKFFDRNGIKPLANGIRDDRMGPTHWMPLPAPPSSAKPAPDAVPGTNPKTTDKGGE